MSNNRIIAGIDIGTTKVCTVIASHSRETGSTNVVGVASSPSQGMRKSQIIDLDEAIMAITDSVEAAERMAGFSISQAFVSVSGATIGSLNSKGVVAVSEPEGEITPLDVERVIEAARAVSVPSTQDVIHVIPRDYMVDSQPGIKDPVGMTGVRLEAEAHLVTGAQTTLKNVHKAVTELGIQVQDLVFSGLASSYSALTETEKELGVVLVDIGGGTTSICAFVDGAITHSSVLPIGAKNISNDLAIGMRVSLASAEKIKLHLSGAPRTFKHKKGLKASEVAKMRKELDSLNLDSLGITEDVQLVSKKALIEGIIRPRLKELFSLVGKQLKDAGLAGQTPAGIVLTGGGAQTVEIIDVAKRILLMPARVGEPKGLKGLVDEIATPEYATASGLVLYGLKHGGAVAPERAGFKMPGIPQLPFRRAYDKLLSMFKSLIP